MIAARAAQMSDGALPCPGMPPAPPAGGGGGGGGALPPRLVTVPCRASVPFPGIGGGEIGEPMAAIDEDDDDDDEDAAAGDGTLRFGLNTEARPMGADADPSMMDPRDTAGEPIGDAAGMDEADVVSDAGRFNRGSLVSSITAGLGVLG